MQLYGNVYYRLQGNALLLLQLYPCFVYFPKETKRYARHEKTKETP